MSQDVTALTRALAQRGLDLAAGFVASRAEWQRWNVPVASHGADVAGLVVGNTRALWPCFADQLASSETLRGCDHPLDEAVMRAVCEARDAVVALRGSAIHWAHVGPPYVAIGRIAAHAGLLHPTPVGLWIHSRYGLWCGLRAVIELPAAVRPDATLQTTEPCSVCDRPCVAAQERVTSALVSVAESMDLRIAVRDACPVGREYRYGPDQLRYHYTDDRRQLPLTNAAKPA